MLLFRHFRDMVDGLAHIHSCGIVHRDLKPSNMLLDQLGNVKISDFGSAVYLSDAEQRCISGGTPAFMAPELFGSESTALASTASDLFGLGATLYCILVGSPPWLGRSQLDHAGKLIKFELEFPSSEIPTPHVRHLLSRMLEKEPTERIGLNDVMVHDWVTAEGLEPLLGEEGRDDSLQALSDEEIRQLF
jgi:serine/threonine protein kinase